MKSKSLFLARYNPANFNDVATSNINYSVNRKVNGIASSLKLAGYPCIIFRTSTGKGDVSRDCGVRRNNGLIVFTPFALNLRIRVLTYTVNLMLSIVQILLLVYKKRIKVIYFWDLLPDTALPALVTKYFNRKIKIILDLEEFISTDPLAPSLFRQFERILLFRNWDIILTSGMDVKNKIRFSENLIIRGFFSESLLEEKICESLIAKRQTNTNEVKTIIFTGRVDGVRGYQQYLDLARELRNSNYKFVAYGFGDQKIVTYFERESRGLVETHFHADRSDLLLGIVNADYCFNYVSDLSFAGGSFPSKLIEFLCLGGTVLSNHQISGISKNVQYFNDIPELSSLLKKQELIVDYEVAATHREMYSIRGAAKKLGQVLNELYTKY